MKTFSPKALNAINCLKSAINVLNDLDDIFVLYVGEINGLNSDKDRPVFYRLVIEDEHENRRVLIDDTIPILTREKDMAEYMKDFITTDKEVSIA